MLKENYNGWDELFKQEFAKPYFQDLKKFLLREYATKTVYPPKQLILNAFDQTSPDSVKAVILGQDPYYNPNQAMGMSFSVPQGVAVPKSLQNIFKEIYDEYGKPSVIKGGDLTPWAKQGVLLLNASLTVVGGSPNSHKDKGWEKFTDAAISYLDKLQQPIVFLLWGRNACEKRTLLCNPQHLVLTAAHPSPLSAYNGFFGCGHFRKTNEFLLSHGQSEIQW